MSMEGYTYEVWAPDAETDSPALFQWGTFTDADITAPSTDLAAVAREIVTVHLTPAPWQPPLRGELRLWTQVTGERIGGDPAYTGDVATIGVA